MAKFNLMSTGLLASIILLLNAVYARPGTPDSSPSSEYQHRRHLEGNGNLHAISVKYQNTPYNTYDGRKTDESHRNATPEARMTRMIPQPPNKEKFLYSDERHNYPEGKSLEPTLNSTATDHAGSSVINGSDTNNTSLSSAPLAREQNANTLKHLWNYQSHKTPTKWTWPSKIDIVFPDHPHTNIPSLGKVRPRCVRSGEVFCTEIDNYPSDLLEQIILSTPERYQDVFGTDVIIMPPVNITQRIDIEEETLCDSKESLIFPKVGLSIDNEWEYIVNLENHTQGIRVEECDRPDTQCNMTESFPFGYEPRCVQKYIYRQLLGLKKDKRVEKNLYKFPSCCQCVLKHKPV